MQRDRKDQPEAPPAGDARPVFDRGEENLPWPPDAALPADDEGNILPGNDPLDEDPNDNGAEEQFDPEDRRRKSLPDPTAPDVAGSVTEQDP